MTTTSSSHTLTLREIDPVIADTYEREKARAFHTEFPEYPAADMPVLPEGFEDISWGQDACPCIHSDSLNLQVWIDFTNPDDREFQGAKRFIVVDVKAGADAIETDDWNDVMAFIAKHKEDRE